MKYSGGIQLKLLMLVSMFFVLCSCDDGENVDEEIDLHSLETLVEIDDVMEEMSSLLEETYFEVEANTSDRTELPVVEWYLSECARITVEVVDGIKNVTIDFGDGCLSKNDNFLKGKLTMSYVEDKNLNAKLVTHGFVDFYIDGKGISGTMSSLKGRRSLEGKKQFTFTEDVLISLQDGSTASRKGVCVYELVETNENGYWWSRVYEIFGNWTIVMESGESYSVEIIGNLRKDLLCKYIESGTKEIINGDASVDLDFGVGICDSEATFIYNNGDRVEIDLEK